MNEIIPSAYMSIRVGTLFKILEAIPSDKIFSFAPEDINIYTKESGIVKKKLILTYLTLNGITTRINGHYRLNVEDKDIEGLLAAITSKNEENKKKYYSHLILRSRIIRQVIHRLDMVKVMKLSELKTLLLNQNITRIHREQLKFIFATLELAGLGIYDEFHGRLTLNKQRVDEIIPKMREMESSDEANKTITNKTEFFIEVKRDGRTLLRRGIEKDKQIIQQLFTKEELIDMLIS